MFLSRFVTENENFDENLNVHVHDKSRSAVLAHPPAGVLDMKYVMESLKHNGIYVPIYVPIGLSVKVLGNRIKLKEKTEQMAIAWVRKEQSITSPPDRVTYRNFTHAFIGALISENTTLSFLNDLHIKEDIDPLINGKPRSDADVDFSEVRDFVVREQYRKASMTKEEKKKLAQERKANREKLKKDYGYATVDGKEIEIANWTAEPSCLFIGRGDHPKRGSWKDGPRQEDITLNWPLDKENKPILPVPPGKWKKVVWERDKMYVAKWEDKLCGKTKYVWFSDSTFMKQEREKEKFKKAENLGGQIRKVEDHILSNLNSEDEKRRKVATVCWLIFNLNMRVGDEKDPGEADTVGAITLRPEHVKIDDGVLHFDFLGKDAVRWTKDAEAPTAVIRNIQHFAGLSKEYLFEGINSRTVTRFFSEKVKGLTAKVFRTWRCTHTVSEYLTDCRMKKEDPDYAKKYCAKMANLEAAKVANHKRKIPANFDERLLKKENQLKELEVALQLKSEQGKATESLCNRVKKSKFDVMLTKETREYNLGTSLKSYIDPMVYVQWASRVGFDVEKFYPKTLRNKFSWALSSC
jgi:DNA topoisomerase I